MAFIAIVIEALGAFRQSEVVIISFGTANVKEIRSSFSCADSVRIYTVLASSVGFIVVHDLIFNGKLRWLLYTDRGKV